MARQQASRGKRPSARKRAAARKRVPAGERANVQPSPLLLCPTPAQLKAWREKLPAFEPLNLRDLFKAAKKQNPENVDKTIGLGLSQQAKAQTAKLLQALGIDPADPRAWEIGFRCLATLHHGLGHIGVYPERTNRNAARWTPQDDGLLVKEVIKREQQGMSERAAIRAIAADPKIKLPYRSQPRVNRESTPAKAKENALWQRLQHVQSRSKWDSLTRLLVPASRTGLGVFERVLLDLDDSEFINHLPKITPEPDSGR